MTRAIDAVAIAAGGVRLDPRDLALTHLALDEAELLDRVVEVTIERDAYRELLQQALDALHTLTRQGARQRETIIALRAELRRYVREHLEREAAA